MKYLIPYILIILLAACTDKPSREDLDLGYDYYPAVIGSYLIYEVDSVYHDQPNPAISGIHDTTHFYLKEYLESSFIDNAGRQSIRLERYKSDSLNGPWELSDVWAVTKTKEELEKVEENVRFIRLAFPVNDTQQWNGNLLNSLPAWNYTYLNRGAPYQNDDTTYAPTVTVLQRDMANAVEVQKAREVYAKGVGLIYKQYKNLSVQINYQNAPIAKNIRLGTEYTWSLKKYGYE